MDIQFDFNGIWADIEIPSDGPARLWSLSSGHRPRGERGRYYPLVEVQGAGFNQDDHHGPKHTLTSPGSALRYVFHTFRRNAQGDVFELAQQSAEVRVITRWQFYDGFPVLRSETSVENIGDSVFPMQYLSSFALTGFGQGESPRSDPDYRVWLPHNTWFGECQWRRYSLKELGYAPVNDFSMKRVAIGNTGTWACSEYLPMGCFEQRGLAMTWQLETSASWSWELSDLAEQLCLRLSGPTWQENHFLKRLKPGERFDAVPCALAFGTDFQDTLRAMTRYRRAIRRPNRDNAHPSVIFNDYMNCLFGDPTTEKELPMIDAAVEAGCKYYCVDCGWYDDGPWWDGVGEWLPAKGRFPGGIEEVLEYIRQKGMVPGLWLELEVMGIQCALAKQLPDDWFFQIEGRRVIDHSRYQLDFRNPDVRGFADGVVDRLVREYGVGYIKMDYNINAGVGTDLNADSPGEGLLSHTRAYLDWLDGVFSRYPDLVIENCSSGGMRMEYSHLSRHSIQSVTDQTDYLMMAAIACNCMTACTPEQAAIWSYPMRNGNAEETVFNMVNAMLFRIHQSGHLAELSAPRRMLVHEGIAKHLEIVDRLKNGLPFWPIGLGSFGDPFLCVGIDCGEDAYLAIWHCADGTETLALPLSRWEHAELYYPSNLPGATLQQEESQLFVMLDGKRARLLRLHRQGRR